MTEDDEPFPPHGRFGMRSGQVEAWKIRPEGDRPAWVFKAFDSGAVYWLWDKDLAVHIDSQGGYVPVPVGDWLLRDAAFRIYAMPDYAFRQTYLPANAEAA